MRLRWRQTLVLLAIIAIMYGLGLVFPIAVQKGLDIVVAGRKEPILIWLVALVVVATAAEALLSRARQSIVIDLATFIDRRIARMAFAHLMRVRIDGPGFRSGETINRFQQARKIQSFALNDVPLAAFEAGNFVVSIVVVFIYDAWVGFALILISPLVLLAVRAPLKSSQVAAEDYYKTIGAQQNVLSESVNAIATVKSLGFEGLRMRLWTETTSAMLVALRKVMDVQRLSIVANQSVARLLSLLVVSVGGLRLIGGHISVGDLFALQVLGGRITGPIVLVSSLYNRYQDVNVALLQMSAFLAVDRERASLRPPVRGFGSGGIMLRDVSLVYPGAARPALAGLNLELPERGVVALVGRNGSGKSTLVRILLGLNRDYSGSIKFIGHDLLSYDPRWLRAHVGVVDQDTVLFSGSIRQNLCGPLTIADPALRDALAFADALDFVEALSGGLDAELTENGRTLSGGQRQRLAIARAVVRHPRVVLLDEPTAFLDAEAAVALEQRLAVWGRERLLILVSHHLAATRDADRILILDEGHLVGDGSHEELLLTVPRYASLWADYIRNLEAA